MKKGDSNILTQFKKIVLIICILVGYHAMHFDVQIPQVEIDTTEEGAEDQDVADEMIQSINAVNFTSQINLDPDVLFFYELPELDEEAEISGDDRLVFTYSSKALRILFRRIISPNAP